MKCTGTNEDGSPCDFSAEKPFHFCPLCGGTSDPVSKEAEEIKIPCPGKDGVTCGNLLIQKFKFCSECGWKIDKTIFAKTKMKCPKCDTDCTEGSKFCQECGESLKKIQKDNSGPFEKGNDINPNESTGHKYSMSKPDQDSKLTGADGIFPKTDDSSKEQSVSQHRETEAQVADIFQSGNKATEPINHTELFHAPDVVPGPELSSPSNVSYSTVVFAQTTQEIKLNPQEKVHGHGDNSNLQGVVMFPHDRPTHSNHHCHEDRADTIEQSKRRHLQESITESSPKSDESEQCKTGNYGSENVQHPEGDENTERVMKTTTEVTRPDGKRNSNSNQCKDEEKEHHTNLTDLKAKSVTEKKETTIDDPSTKTEKNINPQKDVTKKTNDGKERDDKTGSVKDVDDKIKQNNENQSAGTRSNAKVGNTSLKKETTIDDPGTNAGKSRNVKTGGTNKTQDEKEKGNKTECEKEDGGKSEKKETTIDDPGTKDGKSRNVKTGGTNKTEKGNSSLTEHEKEDGGKSEKKETTIDDPGTKDGKSRNVKTGGTNKTEKGNSSLTEHVKEDGGKSEKKETTIDDPGTKDGKSRNVKTGGTNKTEKGNSSLTEHVKEDWGKSEKKETTIDDPGANAGKSRNDKTGGTNKTEKGNSSLTEHVKEDGGKSEKKETTIDDPGTKDGKSRNVKTGGTNKTEKGNSSLTEHVKEDGGKSEKKETTIDDPGTKDGKSRNVKTGGTNKTEKGNSSLTEHEKEDGGKSEKKETTIDDPGTKDGKSRNVKTGGTNKTEKGNSSLTEHVKEDGGKSEKKETTIDDPGTKDGKSRNVKTGGTNKTEKGNSSLIEHVKEDGGKSEKKETTIDEPGANAGKSRNDKTDQTNKTKDEKEKGNNSSTISGDVTEEKRRRERQVNSNDVEVVFHAIISEQIVLDKSDTIFIRFNCAPLGEKQMTFVKKFQNGVLQYRCQVMMAKDIRNGGFDYKYGIQKAGKVLWEEVHYRQKTYNFRGQITDRVFDLPKTKRQFLGAWHQYDGFVYPKKDETVWKKIKIWWKGTFEEKVQADTITATQIFMPKTEDMIACLTKGISLEDELEKIFQVYEGLKHQMRDKYLSGVDETQRVKAFQTILTPLQDHLTRSPEDFSDCSKLVLASFVLLTLWQNDMSHLLRRDPLMLRAFLPHPDPEKKTCPGLEALSKHFPNKLNDIANNLRQSIHQIGTASSTHPCSEWLYLVPLLHFLRKDARPFCKDYSKEFTTPKWWGHEGITKAKEEMKKSYNWTIPPDEIVVALEPLFEVDYLLPRTIMACVRFDQLTESLVSKIPVEISSATIHYYLKTKHFHLGEDLKKFLTYIVRTMTTVFEKQWHLKEKNISERTLRDDILQGQLCMTVCYQLASLCLKEAFETPEMIVETTRLFLASLWDGSSMYSNIKLSTDQANELTRFMNYIQGKMNEISDLVLKWMYARFWGYNSLHYVRSSLQMWDALINSTVIQPCKSEWTGTFLDVFGKILDKMVPRDLLDLHLDDVEVSPVVQDRMMESAFTAFETLALRDDRFYTQISTMSGKFGNLMSRLLERHWPQDNTFQSVLNFVLAWTPLKRYFEKFYGRDKVSNLLSEMSSQYLSQAASVLDSLKNEIINGRVKLSVLRMILKEEDHCLELWSAAEVNFSSVDSDKKADIKILELSLEARKKELKACEERIEQVKILSNLCVFIQTDDSAKLYEQIRDVDKTMSEETISDVCCPLLLQDHQETLDSYQPSISLFNITDNVMQIIPQLEAWSVSMIFKKIWEKEANALQQGIELNEAILQVWQRTKEKWLLLCKAFSDGSLTFKDAQRHLEMFSRDFKKIEKEMKLMCESEESAAWITERIMQLKCFEELQSCQRAAEIVMEIKNTYDIKGDFTPVQTVLELGSNDNKPMRTMDASVLETCQVLEVLDDPERQDCLRAFEKSKPLVDWLRESMSEGLKELKVFVDLAYISAGEEDMEIHKVRCFYSATSGYAPLIFSTPQDSDISTFLDNCKLVWQDLRSDKKLPEKLLDTNRYLVWLKEVKQSHGSVEVTSLTQASMINAKGLYRIGCLEKFNSVSDMTLNNVVSLHVAQDLTEENSARKYNYDQLIDLQSRLMLVAGQAEKGKENVDLFIMILDGIVRLAKTFIQLCADGCVLFNCWKGKFLCGSDRNACAFLEFGHVENHETLKGHRGAEEVDTFVISLAGQLEKFHEEWLQYVSDKRDEYLELNFYTIEQLVFLQQELIKVGTDEEPSERIYPMLSLIKQKCSPADLMNAMKAAKEEVFKKEEEKEIEMEEEVQVVDGDPKQTFINAMIESNFSKRLALLALEEIEPDDIDSGIVWCMENQDTYPDVQEDDPQQTETQMKEEFTGWQVGGESVSSSAVSWVKSISAGNRSTTTVETLLGNLDSVWRKFLDAVSSSVADYLSLEHLGIILRKLAHTDGQQFDRKIPPPLKVGVPNLIVCPQVDMLNAVLHIYNNSEDQPLPQPDEVLLCTAETTFEQVDIFLRRAFFHNPGKAYTLANADLLLYEVEEKTEKKLKEYSNRILKPDYKLIILCSTENEFKARIVAALEKTRCPPFPLQNKKVKDYLASKFSERCAEEDLQSASALDFAGSTVRVVKSTRAGVGKSLYKKRRVEGLQHLTSSTSATSVTIHLFTKSVTSEVVAEKLLHHTLQPGETLPRIIHLDISYEVQEGVDYLLFNLLILGCITNNMGHVWLRSPLDLYLVETIPISDARHEKRLGERLMHPLLEVLPDVYCWSPEVSRQILSSDDRPDEYSKDDSLFDDIEFQSNVYQRPYQYLKRLSTKTPLTGINPAVPEGTHAECLTVLLQHCGVRDPAWSELHNFVWFLNTQLMDFENSVFCSDVILEDLPGFPALVLQFLIQMSRDFATRSLVMSEQSPLDQLNVRETDDEDLDQFQMKRTWESSPHPYIFFNPDGHTMTFLGFNIDRHTGNMVDQQTGAILERALVAKPLQDGLIRNRVNINENFDQMQRLQRLEKLCNVMPGVDFVHDPDDTYELTTDNVKKILAIYMRFRCGIPVIIMGETGCGKTRLVKFMCALQCPPGSDIENMVIMKVHGGTTSGDIIKKVAKAEKLAAENRAKNGHMYTVLFFDEANTTESIGLIKEIMCDGTMDGKPLKLSENLKIVAACNPYRKHSDELIKRLEKAGLGYHVDADKTTDKLGRVPMRRLVYRVQPLPQSMLPLVWDFGQLNTHVEELYVKQMVNRYVRNGRIPSHQNLVSVVSKVLIASQDFMRKQEDECSFVSLRDVDRTLSVMSWFYNQSQEDGTLFEMIDEELSPEPTVEEDEEEETDEEMTPQIPLPNDVTKSLILALSVCYRASLRSRHEYDLCIFNQFQTPCDIPGGIAQMEDVINSCQRVFVDEVQLEDNIAKNLALKENLFMMVVCIELRIPLFLVGKPGSSKSLAKTIVADAMQGNSARSDIFRQLKQVQMVSFQCSPLATAEGIVGTFRQCARYQQDKDLDRFVSIVVLDEVGLAEDSPRMPLKTLHPLLEDGCQGDETPDPHKKVAFIGISNWALDPAKMNRGILVQREAPDESELVESAKGICSSNDVILTRIRPLIPQLAEAYKTIFYRSQETKREFFGLRDFYSLVKMVYAFAEKGDRDVSWHQLKHAVLRNFGGLDNLDPVLVFKDKISSVNKHEEQHEDDPDCTTIGLIKAGLFGDGTNSESRYLLLLTENYGALGILQQQILAEHRVITIFGSSFPKDQEYTQICRNINKIKVCMETGNTVILLNLENLYESLYDALNQYYARLGGERFVDLGLGTHRVKCRVHQNFRLIVVAEKQTVYEEFPIPLINRLEKHFLTLNNMMTEEHIKLSEKLEKWATDFVTPKRRTHKQRTQPDPSEAFMGYHPDTAAAIVLQVCGRSDRIVSIEDDAYMYRECQEALLWCATPQSVVTLKDTKLHPEASEWETLYWQLQKHDDIFKYLQWKLKEKEETRLQAQVTTHSKLLTNQEKDDLAKYLDVSPSNVILLTLQSFDTEQQFAQQIKNFIQHSTGGQKLLMIQCGSGDRNGSLIKSAQYCVQDELPDSDLFVVVFIVQLPNIAGGCFSGFLAGKWHSLHLDELRPPIQEMPSMDQLHKYAPSDILEGIRNGPPSSVEPVEREIEPMVLDDDLMGTESLPFIDTRTSNKHEVEDMDVEQTENIDDVLSLGDIRLRGKDPESVIPYLHHFLLPCIQAAAALIKDEEMNSRRSTKRIEILLTLLDKKEDKDASLFLTGLSRLIISLLKEKEETQQTGAMATDWLSREAAKPENVRRAGTFRRAAMQCLESKITPLLAGVVAFMDTHKNLDFLVHHDSQEWKKQLCLALLSSTKMCHKECKHIIAPGNQNQAIPHQFGAARTVFSLQMPFFWLLYRAIDQARQNVEQPEEETDPDVMVMNIVGSTDYVKVLVSVVGIEERSSVINAYIGDFVHTVYNQEEDDSVKILCDAILVAAIQQGKDLNEMGLLEALVSIHSVHSAAKERLQFYQDVKQTWPEVVEAITLHKTNVGGHPLNSSKEMTLDVFGLMLLLEQLEPSKDMLNTEEGRSQWMDKVKAFLPVIERILKSNNLELSHGPVCCRHLDMARCGWMRVMTMKLFLECFTGNKKIQLETRVMPLWKMLGEQADLTKVASLEKIEMFLKIVNKSVVKKLSGNKEKCCSCDVAFDESIPVELPCKHLICRRCFSETQMTRDLHCPKCQKSFPKSFTPGDGPSAEQRENVKIYETYLKCCNNFLMSVVARLCFGSSDTPEPAVIEKIFSYITRRVGDQQGERIHTKELSVFDDMIDPSPVVRSFLLQLLIHKSEETVRNYLQEFFHQAKYLCQQTRGERTPETLKEIVEFSILVIHCFEDLYHERGASLAREEEVMQVASQHLLDGRNYLLEEDLSMDKMFTIAQCRYGLSVAAKYLHLHVTHGKSWGREFCDLIEKTKSLVELPDTDWPKQFLVKQICREFDTDSYHKICAPNIAPWLTFGEDNQVKECPDRYVVCLDGYQKVREALTKTLLGQDIKHLKQLVKESELSFLLALHREVTMKNIRDPNAPSAEIQINSTKEIEAFIQKTKKKVTKKELAMQILQNNLGRPGSRLNVQPHQSVKDQSLICLLVHTQMALVHFNNISNFLKPLADLITAPQTMAGVFLPTMPQDDMDQIRLSLAKEGALVTYRCPKGTPYLIGECGQPYAEGKCTCCGAVIGGQNHVGAAGNTKDTGADQSRPGHILGSARERSTAFPGERQLEGAACSVLRFFTHAALMLATEPNPQAAAGLVHPPLQGDVGEFFWEHLLKDLQIIHLATGKSIDDVFLFLHFICHQISQSEKYTRANPQVLTTKQERANWEDSFAKTFIRPVLQHLDNCLNECNQRIMNDKRIGQDKLMCVLYEVDKSTPDVVDRLHDFPAVWRFRARITLDHFLREFNLRVEIKKDRKQKMEVLSLFRQEHPYLQALHHVPMILRLQHCLMAKYRRRLDRSLAKDWTIREVADDVLATTGVDIRQLLPHFVQAWDSLRETLHSHACWTVHESLIHLPDAYKNMVVDLDSPLAVLLPSTQGPGICSYMMLEFLFRKHNYFMQRFMANEVRYERLPEVSMRKLHSNHLINYHPERDLLPIILANCNYSFELGKGTTTEYDFQGFEYQLRETILQSKARVEQTSHIIPIETMVYKADTANVVVFKTLRDSIPQDTLAPVVQQQICAELKSNLPDICDSINNLNISISFLKSLGGDSEKHLQSFMVDVLKMKQTILSQKARQSCRFKHAESLWLLLSFEKSVVLARHSQDAFDDLDNELKELLSDDMKAQLRQFCQNKNIEKLELLLHRIFDCLLLRLAQPVDPNDQEAVDLKTMKLCDILLGDMVGDEETLTTVDIAALPADILGKHASDTWLILLREVNIRRIRGQL